MAATGMKLIRAGALLAVLLAAGCSAQFRNHGYAPSDSALAGLTVGRDTRESVAKAVGAPGTTGLLDDNAWYYVESRFRHYGWQAPRETERQVVVISFDKHGRVSNIERFGLEKGHVVVLSRRVTQTAADRTPFLRKVFGNLFSG